LGAQLEHAHVTFGEWRFAKQAEFAGEAFEFLAHGAVGLDERKAESRVATAHEAKDGFGWARIRFPEVGFEEPGVFALDFASYVPVIGECGADHFGEFGRGFVGGDADEAAGADGNGGEGQVVVSGEDFEAVRQGVDERGDLS